MEEDIKKDWGTSSNKRRAVFVLTTLATLLFGCAVALGFMVITWLLGIVHKKVK